MPYKNPEAARAYARSRHARLKAEEPERIAEKQRKQSEYFKKRWKEDEAFRSKRKSDYVRWKQANLNGDGRSISWEQYVAEMTEKRRKAAEYKRGWNKTEAGQRQLVARRVKLRCGLTIDEYDATYDKQGGRCLICGIEKPARYSKDRLVVDHCHKTNKFRALLCSKCNTAIGLLGENPNVIANAITYLGLFQKAD